MANIIREVLDDGTEYAFDIDVCAETAADALDVLVDAQNEVEMFDFATGCLCLFIECVHILTSAGWTEQALVNEIFEHSEQHREPIEIIEIDDPESDEADSEEDSDEGTVTISHRGSNTIH